MGKDVTSYQDDLALVNKARSGSMAAFREIVEKYEKMVARVTHGMLGNSMDAEDIGQETFIRFYNSIGQYKGDSSLSTYLTRISINLSLNEIKKRKRQSWLSYEDQLQSSGSSGNEGHKLETTDLVNKALEKLDPDFRSVVVLRIMQGYSTKETADILNIPLGTALSRLARAQLKLKEILKKLGADG